ncbi:MAG: peptidoglycan-binding protein [Patescibacteria group bacterium]|nr:peptidoglycan-binding protein [Patescibacteria group bacterium]
MFKFLSDFMPHVLELGFATPATQPARFVFNNNLSFLMLNNPDVHALQVRLGMPPEYQTGNFLGKTLAAVLRFQAANGLPVTGFVGPLTRAVLNK